MRKDCGQITAFRRGTNELLLIGVNEILQLRLGAGVLRTSPRAQARVQAQSLCDAAPRGCRVVPRTEPRPGASAHVSARQTARGKPWFLAATLRVTARKLKMKRMTKACGSGCCFARTQTGERWIFRSHHGNDQSHRKELFPRRYKCVVRKQDAKTQKEIFFLETTLLKIKSVQKLTGNKGLTGHTRCTSPRSP